MSPALSVSPQRRAAIMDGRKASKISFPSYIESLNPYMYYQGLNAGSGNTLADSASPTQLVPNGHAWNELVAPPPHDLVYGLLAQSTPGLLNDTRTAAKGAASGAIASAAWAAGADVLMAGSGWWIATHTDFTETNGQIAFTGDVLWTIPVEIGQSVFAWISPRSDLGGGETLISVLCTSTGSGYQGVNFVVPTLTSLVGKHEIIIRTTKTVSAAATLVTCWLDGVNLGTLSSGPLPAGSGFEYLSEGFQVGGTLLAGDGFTVQDVVVMPLGYSPGTDMTDILASGFFAQWQSAGG